MKYALVVKRRSWENPSFNGIFIGKPSTNGGDALLPCLVRANHHKIPINHGLRKPKKSHEISCNILQEAQQHPMPQPFPPGTWGRFAQRPLLRQVHAAARRRNAARAGDPAEFGVPQEEGLPVTAKGRNQEPKIWPTIFWRSMTYHRHINRLYRPFIDLRDLPYFRGLWRRS